MKMLKKIFLSLFILILSVLGIFYIQNEKNKDITFPIWAPTRISTIIPISTPIPIVPSFSFAVISDIHGDLSSLKKALYRIKTDKMDFIIPPIIDNLFFIFVV